MIMQTQVGRLVRITFAWMVVGLAGALTITPWRQAAAQARGEPAAAISTIYKLYQKPGEPKLPKGIYSPRLQKLFDADRKRTPKDDIGRLDFDPFINGQDWDIKSVVVTEASRQGDRATVRVTFTNFGKAQEIVYDLVRGSQRWQIDDIASQKDPRWTLSKILAGAPDAFPDAKP